MEVFAFLAGGASSVVLTLRSKPEENDVSRNLGR
jgi:hypothetical protein